MNEVFVAGVLRESSDVEGDVDVEAFREGGNGVMGLFIVSVGVGDDFCNDGLVMVVGEILMGVVICVMWRSARFVVSFVDAREARFARGLSNVWMEIGVVLRMLCVFVC